MQNHKKLSKQVNTTSFKAWANMAIAKYAQKIFKYEAKVIKDKDPENLHQMRVGVRRLRSAINNLNLALDLPASITERNLGKIGRSLGKLRDLDVLMAQLEDGYRPQLPQSEQEQLDIAILALHKQRQHKLQSVRKTLKGQLYLNLKQELAQWLSCPQYLPQGNLALNLVVPDLLLPQVSQLLLHPGWLVGVELATEQELSIVPMSTTKAVKKILDREETLLHDLRKTAKQTRYNLELFSQFYDAEYQNYLEQIEQIQAVLGEIQDAYVLRAVLEQVLKTPIKQKMPELAQLLNHTRDQKWQQWSILQQRFLSEATRQELREVICRVGQRDTSRLN